MNNRLVIAILSIIAIHAFDELVLTIALPVISNGLGLSDLYGITFATYILCAISGMRVSGSYIDALGPRRVISLGLILFLLGNILSSIAWDAASFIASRALQGLGGGICITCAFALINILTVDEQRHRLITGIDLAWVIPSLAAPVIGGLLVDFLSWRAIFIMQIPILIAVMLLFSKQLAPYDKHEPLPPLTVLLEALGISFGTGLMLYVLSLEPSLMWLLAFAGASLAFYCFNRAMPNEWWLGKTMLTLPLLVGMLGFTAFYGMEAFQPLYLIHNLGWATTQAGIIVTFASFSWLAASYLAIRLYKRYPPIFIMLSGSVVLFVGILCHGLVIFLSIPPVFLYLAWVICGFGMGFIFNSIRTSAMENAPSGKEGFVSTAITLSINIGIAFSAGIGGIFKNHSYETTSDLSVLILLISLSGTVFCLVNISIVFRRFRQRIHLS